MGHDALPPSRRFIPTDQSLRLASPYRAAPRVAYKEADKKDRNEGDRPDDEDEKYFEEADASHLIPTLREAQRMLKCTSCTRFGIDLSSSAVVG